MSSTENTPQFTGQPKLDGVDAHPTFIGRQINIGAVTQAQLKAVMGEPEGNAHAYLDLGDVSYKGRNFSEALSYYDEALVIDPKYIVAWYKRGEALCMLERYEEGLAICDKTVDLNPKDPVAWRFRAAAMNRLGRFEEELASANMALAQDPKYRYAWLLRNNALDLLGRYREAAEAFKKYQELLKSK